MGVQASSLDDSSVKPSLRTVGWAEQALLDVGILYRQCLRISLWLLFEFTIFLSKTFSWSISDVQCCISFMCIAKQFSSYIYIHIRTHIHTHIYVLFQNLFPYRLLWNIEYSSRHCVQVMANIAPCMLRSFVSKPHILTPLPGFGPGHGERWTTVLFLCRQRLETTEWN